MSAIDIFSVSAIPIEMFFNETLLGVATSFSWQDENAVYLITNWHNFTGKSSTTGKHISKTLAEPSKIRIYLNTKGKLGSKTSEDIEIFDADHKPLWLINPQLGKEIDVVALKIRPKVSPDWYSINTIPTMDLTLAVAHDVYILGYPFGIGPGGYPIWKRGSIASEPKIFTSNQRHILVDSASRPGMSGSPVIRRSWGTHMTANGDTIMNGATETKFVGVYSGRLATTDPLDAQLGLVWPASYISEIIAGRRRDI